MTAASMEGDHQRLVAGVKTAAQLWRQSQRCRLAQSMRLVQLFPLVPSHSCKYALSSQQGLG